MWGDRELSCDEHIGGRGFSNASGEVRNGTDLDDTQEKCSF